MYRYTFSYIICSAQCGQQYTCWKLNSTNQQTLFEQVQQFRNIGYIKTMSVFGYLTSRFISIMHPVRNQRFLSILETSISTVAKVIKYMSRYAMDSNSDF